jgi:dTDP-glucose 4,6-dehydratase
MTRVLLTGAGGFAGAHCLEHLLTITDWDIVATDSFRHKGKTDRIAQVIENSPHADWRQRIEVIMHNLGAPFSRQSFIDMAGASGIDYVIAYASDSHVDRSIVDPVPFVLNNAGVALSTLELCRQLKPKALVWVSTDEVYGPQPNGVAPFAEWSSILPSNPYAASKAAQEALCTAYWRTYDVPVIIVNAMNMIGERQDPEKFVPKVIRSVLNGERVTVHGTPDNIGTRHYLHARNTADGIAFLLRNDATVGFPDASRPARFHIASPDRVDNLTLAQMIADAAGRKLTYELTDFHATRPGHDPHYGLDSRKIANLGWKAPVPFAESLERTVRWTMNHREWLED